LEDGIGDTIRVSLTEDSIHEIPVAQALVKKFNERVGVQFIAPVSSGRDESRPYEISWNPFEYTRRPSETVTMGPQYVGGKHVVRVQVTRDWTGSAPSPQFEREIEQLIGEERLPEIVSFHISESDGPDSVEAFLEYSRHFKKRFPNLALGVDLGDSAHLFPQLAPAVHKISLAPSRRKNEAGWKAQAVEILRIAKQLSLALEWKLYDEILPAFAKMDVGAPLVGAHPVDSNWGRTQGTPLLLQLAHWSQAEGLDRFSVCWAGSDGIYENRRLASLLDAQHLECVIHLSSPLEDGDHLLETSGDLGALLLDGIGDSLETVGSLKDSVHLAYNILQGARQRISKTEFIACPSCGRTLFDLQTTTARIKKITSHLKGVKIAIMGCIVNGPGEMADADFGYVGGSPNRIHLYVGKECVEKNIPQEEADQRLVDLIKKHGRWVEPPERTQATPYSSRR
jgi:(E)-4-hydroxy-3-methylbut-2-enyl-diphosphate synthase